MFDLSYLKVPQIKCVSRLMHNMTTHTIISTLINAGGFPIFFIYGYSKTDGYEFFRIVPFLRHQNNNKISSQYIET
jgi:hypothetical protein